MSIQHPKILYLFSAPLVAPDGSPLDALDMKAEKNTIVRELAACKRAGSLRIGVATIDEFARSIEEEFNILHVSSHGYEEFLLFEDGKGGSQPVTGDYLTRLIRMGRFELAIVSACYSEKIGALLVEAGIPHVVAIKCDVPVLDHAAVIFVGQFFRSLFKGDSVQKAFDMAQLVVEGNPKLMRMKHRLEFTAYRKSKPFVPEEKKFVLLPEESTHSDPLLSQKVPQGTLTIEEPTPSQSNLPVKPQTFTGRSVEMHAIINKLSANRFVTITGVGGIGKTIVAIEVARWLCSRRFFPDGIFYVDLRQTDTADGIIDLLGAAFDVHFSDLKNVITYLRERHCLLLLDNAEDILWQDEDAMQDIIDSLLKFTLNTTLLITSQRSVGGNLYEPERVYRLYSLKQNDAALLFYVTTKRRMSQREYESHTFYTMLEQLGGHPLSIVLTARQLAPGVHLEDLLERIKMYKAKAIQIKNITDRDLEHGESLVASLASAHHVLSDKAQTLFEILSMLPAGAQQNKLKKIYGSTAWKYVQELNDASLVEIREHKRATLLPPVRLFAMSICTDEIKEYYGPKIMEVMGEYAKELYNHHSTKDAKEYRFYFTVDEPNLRSAVDLPCVPPQTDKEPSVLGSFGPFLLYLYIFHNRWKEAKKVGERILSNLRRLQDQLGEANTLTTLGMLTYRTGELEKAQKRYEKALKIYENIDEKMWEANTLWALGNLSMRTGNNEEAQKRYKKALTIYQDIDKKLGEANTLIRLGDLATLIGNHEEAQKRYDKALTIYQDTDEKLGEANTIRRLGDLVTLIGNHEEAQKRYKKALAIYQFIDVRDGEARILVRLAQYAALINKLEHAETYLANAFTIYRDTEDLEGQAEAHLVRALIFLSHHNTIKAKHELDCCSFIQNKIRTHGEVAQWLLLYAVHFNLHEFQEGAEICLEYAEKFASKTQNQHLQHQVKQRLSEIV